MRQVLVRRHGGPEVMSVVECAEPEPAAGEVLLAVSAAGVNYADVLGRIGVYAEAPPVPFVPGYEVSGTVTAVGPGTSDFHVGDRVAAMTLFGGYASNVTAPAQRVIRLPEKTRFEEGAAVPVAYVTAWLILVGFGRCRPDETVYLESAAGGVGLACIDLASLLGLKVIPAASAVKRRMLCNRGFQAVLDADDPGRWNELQELTGGRGVDLAVLSRAEAWGKAMGSLASGGRLGVIGSRVAGGQTRSAISLTFEALTAPWTKIHPFALMRASKGMFGFNLHRLVLERSPLVDQAIAAVTGYWNAGKLRPTIDSAFPLEAAGQAHERLYRRLNVGKIVLKL